MKKLFILFLSGFLTFCNSKERPATEMVNNWKAKRLELPLDSIIFNAQGVLTKPHEKDLKILSLINGGCGSCIEDLAKWKTFMGNIDTSKVGFIFLVYSEDGTVSKQEFKNKDSLYINLKYPYYDDLSYTLFLKNNFPSKKLFQTFLINQENEVQVIGNPLMSSEISNLYKTAIDSRKRGNNE
ncbi:hypothetical protein [Salegentibacter sp. Hel_I_6]|uniref:hypothetical protein n=1 Tax=Salegentibacter sp. Hel_I_6 TaxID=1250278 RepID=UPI00056D6EEE|nr:hypothetical protein [Salegentibacter sp. Hel_I_6]